MNNKLRGYVRPDGDDAQVETWGWPEMAVEVEPGAPTNALGLAPDWYQQEEEVVEPEPPMTRNRAAPRNSSSQKAPVKPSDRTNCTPAFQAVSK